MKISLNWLSDFIDTTPIRADLKGVLSKLTMRGLEVESIQDLSKGFDKVIIAYVEERTQHPNADRLSVCKVNNGTEILQIVCGAPNVKAGEKVVLSMIGAELPCGIKIEKGKIRDVESWGMLCSEKELGLSDESQGIILLPKDAPIGKPLAPFLGRDDIVFEINVTPNRGDALSHLGVARELASILGQKLKLPDSKVSESVGSSSDKIQVTIQNPSNGLELCYQYHGRYIEDVKIKPSPEWMQRRLKAVGLRPINNVVDVTNYVLMETGQPLHAFDYSQLKGGQIQVRLAKKGEKLPLLDGTQVSLTEEDLVIADLEKPVALAGVMGGGNSEVTEKTSKILLEVAQFAPSTVRKTSRKHQKSSDSSYRFERQVDARGLMTAMDRAAKLIQETAGGKVYKGIVSRTSSHGESLTKAALKSCRVSVSVLNRFLGVSLNEKQVQECFRAVGFEADNKGDFLDVRIPSYRPDVTMAQDLYEEVLRVWGYEKIEAKVPRLDFIPEPTNIVDLKSKFIEKLKSCFVNKGFSESVNFGFTSKSSNDRWGGEESKNSVELLNPLNEEFSTMKTSLIGGLLENLFSAIRHQQRDVRLFEMRPVYVRDEKFDTGVREEWRIAAVMTGRSYSHSLAARDSDVDFFDLKGVLEALVESLAIRGLRLQDMANKKDSRFHLSQCASIVLGKGPCGVLGRLHPKIEAENKLRQAVYLFEFSLDRLLEMAKSDRKYVAVSKFPKMYRDFSLLVPQGMATDKLVSTIQKYGKPLVESVAVVDLYSGDKIPTGTQSVSVSLVIGDPNRTLEDKEVDAISQKVLVGLEKDLFVKLRLQ